MARLHMARLHMARLHMARLHMTEKGFNPGVKKILYCRINHFCDLCYIIIITITTRHQFCLDRPVSACLTVPSKVSKVVFVQSVYNSELFLASFCFCFLLHVVVNSICIFLVTSQLVLLSPLPKFFHPFCGQKGRT